MMAMLVRGVFGLGSVSLMLIALALMIYAPFSLITTALSGAPFERELFDAIGVLIVAIAVFDVAKYILEEEVISRDERRHAAETRRSLTKFGSTIVIAVLLEALVLGFEVAREDPSQLIYPILLMLAGTILLVAIGVFQRLSASTEQIVPETDPEASRPQRRKPTPKT